MAVSDTAPKMKTLDQLIAEFILGDVTKTIQEARRGKREFPDPVQPQWKN